MGGTSTDVAHFAGEYERSFETQIAGVRIAVPMLRVHTVAAGGGSIIAFDGTRFRVGPDSAGANPGPHGLPPRRPADRHRRQRHARQARRAVLPADFRRRRTISRSTPTRCAPRSPISRAKSATAARRRRSPTAAIRIAVENMANAIKKISVERGYDVTEYALNCFGSAGGQHACLIADTLGIETVLVHPLSGLLSAYGMGLAQQRASRERSIEAPLDGATMRELENLAYELGSAATEELLDQGVEHDAIAIESFVHLRYAGTDTALPVPLSEPGFMRRDFEALHRQRFGFISPEKDIVAAAIEVAAAGGDAVARSPPAERVGVRGSTTAASVPPSRLTLPVRSGEQRIDPLLFARGVARGAGRAARGAACRAPSSPARRSSSSRTRPSSSSPAGRWRSPPRNDIVLTRAVPRAARAPRRRPPTRCCSRCSTTCSWPSPSRWAKRCATRRSR